MVDVLLNVVLRDTSVVYAKDFVGVICGVAEPRRCGWSRITLTESARESLNMTCQSRVSKQKREHEELLQS